MKPNSPYSDVPISDWIDVTEKLISQHPFLGSSHVGSFIDDAWNGVWGTSVGRGTLTLPLRELEPRAQIVGDFFENLLAYKLSLSGDWKRGSSKEKDVIYLKNPAPIGYDFEIKTSGQRTGKIYGNRSYAQPGEDGSIDSPSRKKRSGYYLCINFFGECIFNVRAGWIDPEDWEPQESETGQMAGLKPYVYTHKLLTFKGDYILRAPTFVINGVGEKTEECLKTLGFCNVQDLVIAGGDSLNPRNEADRVKIIENLVSKKVSKRVAIKICDNEYFRCAYEKMIDETKK